MVSTSPVNIHRGIALPPQLRARDEPGRLPSVSARRGVMMVGLPIVAAFIAGSCGPSFESIHEGNVRFEHCFRLDMDDRIAPSHRLHCWRQWLSTYTYGQTRDRVRYALERVRALHRGDSAPANLMAMADASPEGSAAAAGAAPEPTSPDKAPPAVAPKPEPAPESAEPDAGPVASAAPPPKSECAQECSAAWESCAPKCEVDGGAKPPPACEKCRSDYRRCMQRCYR